MNIKPYIQSKIVLITTTSTLIIALFFTAINWQKNLTTLSNALFTVGAIVLLIGIVFSLIATSSWHYYKHSKELKKGKKPTEEIERSYELSLQKRQRQLVIGVSIGIGSLVALLLSTLLAMVVV